jgi:hypothetical protein
METSPQYNVCVKARDSTFERYGHGYEPPTASEVRWVMKLLCMTGSKFGKLVGVESRTVRKWTSLSPDSFVQIPYAAWRLAIKELGYNLEFENQKNTLELAGWTFTYDGSDVYSPWMARHGSIPYCTEHSLGDCVKVAWFHFRLGEK